MPPNDDTPLYMLPQYIHEWFGRRPTFCGVYKWQYSYDSWWDVNNDDVHSWWLPRQIIPQFKPKKKFIYENRVLQWFARALHAK